MLLSRSIARRDFDDGGRCAADAITRVIGRDGMSWRSSSFEEIRRHFSGAERFAIVCRRRPR